MSAVWTRTRRTLALVTGLGRGRALALVALALVGALLPAAIAWAGRGLVEAVVACREAGAVDLGLLAPWVALEALLALSLAAIGRLAGLLRTILGMELGHDIEQRILRKAQRLTVGDMERSSFYDRLARARREAGTRPLYVISRLLGGGQQALTLLTVGVVLLGFSPLAVLLLLAATLPTLWVELRYSRQAYTLANRRTPEARERSWIGEVLTRERHAKDVRQLGLGPWLADRHQQIFARVFPEDRSLARRRTAAATAMGSAGTLAMYGTLGWIAWETAAGRITLGDMTMYAMLFRQGQTALSGALVSLSGFVEDQLYLSNLFEFMDLPEPVRRASVDTGEHPGRGLELTGARFRYPGAETEALRGVDLRIAPGERVAIVGENGSGKSTLVKLLTGIYGPSGGRALLDGSPVSDWAPDALRRQTAVLFQDFLRLQLSARENIVLGQVDAPDRDWRRAASLARVQGVIDGLPRGVLTRLGRWFEDGVELSGGQWQRVALARVFQRTEARFLVLDEPTSALDPEAEVDLYDRLTELPEDVAVVLVSHRLSTVRRADRIVVLSEGRIVEEGSHAALMARGGAYARLFQGQAAWAA